MQKLTSIIIIVLIGVSIILGIQLNSTNDKLDAANESIVKISTDFDKYKKDVDVKLRDLYSLNAKNQTEHIKFINKQTKLVKDTNREHIITAKPVLVGKLITESFNKFTQELQEATK